MYDHIELNLEEIKKRINDACKRVGRDPEEVTLVAVSKMNPAEAVQAAYDCGQTVFGENKVQELGEKIDVLPSDIDWHLIGHLQTNKVKYVVGRVSMIQSVDSYRLAEAIDKESAKKGIVSDILLEVNMAEEDSKFGIIAGDVLNVVRDISKLQYVRICGLMTVAPFTENAEDNRLYFRQMKDLSVDIASQNVDNVSMHVLSMGMTGDFEVAVEEGATHVRVGTGIFGARNYLR